MIQSIVAYIIVILAAVYAIRRAIVGLKRNDESYRCDRCDACRMKKELQAKTGKRNHTTQRVGNDIRLE